MAVKQRGTFPVEVSAEFWRRKTNPKYFTYHERWLQKPGIHADLTQTGEATSHIANPNWGITGAGAAATADVTFNAAGGGIKLETQATAEDEVIIEPHTTAGTSILDDMQWSTSKQPYMYIDLVTGDALTNRWMWAGYVMATGASQTTFDAMAQLQTTNAFYLAFATENLTSTANWCSVSTRVSAETETDSAVALVASTRYRIELWLDSARKPQYYINGAQVCTADSTAIAAATDLFPIIGLHSISTNEADFVVNSVMVSQLYG
jgi:hypothetical protein